MPFNASTVQDNGALPACAHLPPRQRFSSTLFIRGWRPASGTEHDITKERAAMINHIRDNGDIGR